MSLPKPMSTHHQAPGFQNNRSALLAVIGRHSIAIALLWVGMVVSSAHAQFSEEKYQELSNVIQKESRWQFIEGSIAALQSGMESPSDEVRMTSIAQVIKLVGLVLSARDLSIAEHARAGMWSRYDGSEFGGKALPRGPIVPKAISDSRVRERYVKELAIHEALINRLAMEDDKVIAVERGIKFTRILIEAAKNSEKLAKKTEVVVQSLPGADWIKEYIRAKLKCAECSCGCVERQGDGIPA